MAVAPSVAELGRRAKLAARALGTASTGAKDAALIAAAELLEQRAADIQSANQKDLDWTLPEDALRGVHDLGVDKGKLLDLTEDFITIEKEGINEYRSLIHESKGYYRDLFVLLFRSMIRDSEKHIEILEFLRERLKEA